MASTHDEAGDFMSPPVASSASFFVRWAGVFAGPCRSGTADQKRWRCTGPAEQKITEVLRHLLATLLTFHAGKKKAQP